MPTDTRLDSGQPLSLRAAVEPASPGPAERWTVDSTFSFEGIFAGRGLASGLTRLFVDEALRVGDLHAFFAFSGTIVLRPRKFADARDGSPTVRVITPYRAIQRRK